MSGRLKTPWLKAKGTRWRHHSRRLVGRKIDRDCRLHERGQLNMAGAEQRWGENARFFYVAEVLR